MRVATLSLLLMAGAASAADDATWKRYETELAALAEALGPSTLNRFDQGQEDC